MLDFLQDIKIDEETIVARKGGGGGGHRKQWSPPEDLLAIRVWRTGAVYPSKTLVDRFDLEYHDRPVVPEDKTKIVVGGVAPEKWVHAGSALDVFSSKDFPAFKSPKPLLLANVTARSGGKTDLFSTVGWDKTTGEKLASVLDQGAITFGKDELLPLLKDTYGIELNEENPFVDLVFVGKDGAEAKTHFAIEKGFCFVPKTVTRGDKMGAETVVRREDPWIFVLMPLAEVFPDRVEKPEPKKEKTEKKAKLSIAKGAKVPGAEPNA